MSQGASVFDSTAVILSVFAPPANPFGMVNETPSNEIGVPAAWVAACVLTCVERLSVGEDVYACIVAATPVPTSSIWVGVDVPIVPAENEQPFVPMTTPRSTNRIRFFMSISFQELCEACPQGYLATQLDSSARQSSRSPIQRYHHD